MTLEEIITRAQIVGKTDKTRQFYVLKILDYAVDYMVVDVKRFGIIGGEKKVSFQEYDSAKINEEFDIKLYSPNGKKWYVSKEEAEKNIRD